MYIERNFSPWHDGMSLYAGELTDPPVLIATACCKLLPTGGHFFQSRGYTFLMLKNLENVQFITPIKI